MLNNHLQQPAGISEPAPYAGAPPKITTLKRNQDGLDLQNHRESSRQDIQEINDILCIKQKGQEGYQNF